MSSGPSSTSRLALVVVLASVVAGGVGLLVGARLGRGGSPAPPPLSRTQPPGLPVKDGARPAAEARPAPRAEPGDGAIAAAAGEGAADRILSEAGAVCGAVAAELLGGGTLEGRAAAPLREAHKEITKSLAPFANELHRCAAVLDDDDKRCDNVPESSRDGCVLEWALFHDARRGSGKGALFAEGMLSFCRRFVGSAESCAALGEAVRSGDGARCPADKREACEAVARRQESGCRGDKGCLHLLRALSLIEAGGAGKLAAEGDEVDKELGAAALGDKQGCRAVVDRFTGKCVEYARGLVKSQLPRRD